MGPDKHCRKQVEQIVSKMPYYYYVHRGGNDAYHRIGFRKPPDVVLWLIIVNFIVYLIEAIDPNRIIMLFGLVPPMITQKLYLWQFFTYMFLHGSFLHIFFNMFSLYIFGHDLFIKWGAKRFLSYYFITGIGAGLCAYLFTNVPTIGASGAVYGLLLAYGVTFPNRLLLLYFFIPIRAKYLVVIFGLIEFFATLGGTSDGIAHIAHLGGMVFGAMMLLFYHLGGKMKKISPTNPFDDFTILHPQEPEDIDKILDKILQQGVESLTPKERAILAKAGKFISQHPAYRNRTHRR